MLTLPTEKQIYKASLFGWTYIGDGMFDKDNVLGYYTESGWMVEL